MMLDFYIYRQANDFKIYAINDGYQPSKHIDSWRIYAGPFESMPEAEEYLHKNHLVIGENDGNYTYT